MDMLLDLIEQSAVVVKDQDTLLDFIEQSAVVVKDHVLKDVVVCGQESCHGYRYPEHVLRESLHLYENFPVHVDHEYGSTPGRRYADRIGSLQNPRFETGKIRADLHLNPRHSLYEQVVWDYKNNTKGVGLSHHAKGPVNNGVVTRIERLVGVDLVDGPATVKSLREQAAGDPPPVAPVVPQLTEDKVKEIVAGVLKETLTAFQKDLKESIKPERAEVNNPNPLAEPPAGRRDGQEVDTEEFMRQVKASHVRSMSRQDFLRSTALPFRG